MASITTGVECVFLSCFDHNALFLASMLGRGGIRLHRACTLETADFLLLVTGPFDVLWRPIELERLRSSIWKAHEATVERRLWLAEREREGRCNQHSVSGVRLETV